MKKTNGKLNKPTYLSISILDISKTLMYEFWYDCIKPKDQHKAKLCYTDTDSFVIHIKAEEFYKGTANNIEKRFDTSNYDNNRPLAIGMNKKVIGLLKDDLGGKIMTGFVGLRAKTYAYLVDDDSKHKKAKVTNKCVIKRTLKFNDYKNCQSNNKIMLKSQQRFKSDCHNVCAEQINKIALGSNDDKRLQTFDKVKAYPYGTNAFKVCESEMLSTYK